MYDSNRCFLTCIQISQGAGQLVWYSHLFRNFPQFLVIHTVKGFSVVKAEVDVFLELSSFFYDSMDVGNLISGSSSFSKSSFNIWKFLVHMLLSLAWRILSIALLANDCNCVVVEHSLVLPFFGFGMKTVLSSPVATAEFSRY